MIVEQGGIVKAAADATGCVHDDSSSGIDVAALLRHMQGGGRLGDYARGEKLLRDEIFAVRCDVLVPAALGGVIDGALQLPSTTADVLPCL